MKGLNTGLVAFFDVLGYKKLIESNSLTYVAKLISDELVNLPQALRDSLSSMFRNALNLNREDSSKISNAVSQLVISDSVLLTAKIKRGLSNFEQLEIWLIFSLFCKKLFEILFEKGLPLRGAIGYGEFFKTQTCFHGKPIIEAYEVANNLELSTCVFTRSASQRWEDLFALAIPDAEGVYNLLRSCFLMGSVPLKGHQYQAMYMISPKRSLYSTKNIQEKVYKSFSSHDKTITEKEFCKIKNTVMMFEFFRERSFQIYRKVR